MLLSLQLPWLSSLSTLRHTDRHLKTTQNRVSGKLTPLRSPTSWPTHPSTGTKPPAFLIKEPGLCRRGGTGMSQGCCPCLLSLSLSPSFILKPMPWLLPPPMALTLPETMFQWAQGLFSRCSLTESVMSRPSRVPLKSFWHQR